MIQKFLTIFFVLFGVVQTHAQDFSGIWQGLITVQSDEYKKSNILYLDLKVTGTEVEGFARIESRSGNYYAYKKVYGTVKEGNLKFRDVQIIKQVSPFKKEWCLDEYEFTLDPKTAYLNGSYKSNECAFEFGKIIGYRSKEIMISKSDSSLLDKGWTKKFLSDLKVGRPAPEVMDHNMKNFIFQPVNFDHDSSVVKPEYHKYLEELSEIVMSHPDLRIKIIGHTDAVGSNEYNVGLSKRRAESIKEFLVKQGLKADRIEIEYKGETQPIKTNDTDEGKAQNRRVDVIFI
ncbi:MAG: OmpA family protein [Crocinitomicaceae bacterium]|nr:OmpA family protein [Crocinitomicaceae bacterium]